MVELEKITNDQYPITKKFPMIKWSNVSKTWLDYAKEIVDLIAKTTPISSNSLTLNIETDLPLGKGMGSSTALVIAMSRCLLGDDCRAEALEIENELNPNHSGIDFAVIWEEKPLLFQKGSAPKSINLPASLLNGSRLIDTGTPNESTPELVAWVRSRYEAGDKNIRVAIQTIGRCTERIVIGESLQTVIRDHHLAQVALGVVTPEARHIITDIENKGGAAKVLGAGARTGGCGMVLAFE